ncbi:MAG: FtsX-like permease family protein, partial [Huintestinicola sp.]
GYDYYELKDRLSESGYFDENIANPFYIYYEAVKGTVTAEDNKEYRFKTDYVSSQGENIHVLGHSLTDMPLAIIYDKESIFKNGSIISAQPQSFNGISAGGMPELKLKVIIPDDNTEDMSYRGYFSVYMTNEMIDEYEQKLKESCPDYMAKVAEREIFLMTKNPDDFDRAKEFIESVIPEGAAMRDLKSEISEFDYLFRLIRLMAAAIVIVFALIAVSNIFNITVSGISESRRSYGLLRAVGMTDRQLEKTAAVQTFLPIIYASVITLILTAAAVIIIAVITGEPIIEKTLEFTEPHKALIRVIIASAAAFSVAALAAYFPLMRIEKSTVSDSVRFEA